MTLLMREIILGACGLYTNFETVSGDLEGVVSRAAV